MVSDDCALDEEELKTLAADIKKQPKLTQPNFFIDMRYDYKFIQLQALLKITELLQPVIQGNIKNKTSDILVLVLRNKGNQSRQTMFRH